MEWRVVCLRLTHGLQAPEVIYPGLRKGQATAAGANPVVQVYGSDADDVGAGWGNMNTGSGVWC